MPTKPGRERFIGDAELNFTQFGMKIQHSINHETTNTSGVFLFFLGPRSMIDFTIPKKNRAFPGINPADRGIAVNEPLQIDE